MRVRVSPFVASSVLLLLIASSASAVTMAWTSIGNPGNACDPQPGGLFPGGCFGAVGYAYQIGTYEVTNSQYAEFLNAKAASDPLELYNTHMDSVSDLGGVTRSGSSGSFAYSTIPGRENTPVNYVSFYDALRFANWMNNGQGNADTETGSYTLLGGTAAPSNGDSVTRNAGATIFLTSGDEWYKAAYYNPATSSYFDFPAGSNTQTVCATPSATANTANCGYPSVVGDLTSVGSYPNSPSSYGTFDQGGNVFEFDEVMLSGGSREIRGGSFNSIPSVLAASIRFDSSPVGNEGAGLGFRLVAIVPEPSTGLLMIAGLLGLAGWRRACA